MQRAERRPDDDRVNLDKQFTSVLGVDPGGNLTC
jgi:hypothetical protein